MGNNIRGMLQCLGNPVYGFPCYIVLAALAVCVSSWLGYKGGSGRTAVFSAAVFSCMGGLEYPAYIRCLEPGPAGAWAYLAAI